MARLRNPLAFTPLPVVLFTSVTYIALFAALLIIHLSVPKAPTSTSSTPAGTNLTQAWVDLEHITRRFHPYNSHANDDVHAYLLSRIQKIVTEKDENLLGTGEVEIIVDNVSNATFSSRNTTVYFEGTNLIVAIRGSEDKEPLYAADQPADEPHPLRAAKNGGVLVNAHYDSVSSGYGATDDGVGVVCVLQLLDYLTEPQNWPKRTVILLLNNGEEDFLNGAKAFMRHPISQLPHTFLNLEGAGAGGRATLFRSTDEEVTRPYRESAYPFGAVVSADGFKAGLVASQTDYVVFNGELGLRGLDVAFMEPRARYHTIEDSTRETNLDSVWHMLSAALATTSGLANDMSDTFSGSGRLQNDGKVDAGSGSEAVWFDLFGKAFVVFRLHTLFALNVTLLVVAPITLILLHIGLAKTDKHYIFARRKYVHSSADDEPVLLGGWRGFFRFPITFVVAGSVNMGLAYLLVKVNPYIVHSSPYAVWSMMLSAWFFSMWFLLRGASFMRPSALQRLYSLLWLFLFAYALLIYVTILAHDRQIAGGYFVLFYFAAIFVALVISYIELFFAPTKAAFVTRFDDENDDVYGSAPGSRPLTGNTSGTERVPTTENEPTETTSLLRGPRPTFARHASRHSNLSRSSTSSSHQDSFLGSPYPSEQSWSAKMPSSLWVLQFLFLVPIPVILVAQISLLLTSALYQTAQDGGSALFIYIAFAALSVLLLAPISGFLHRFTWHIPTFLLLICIGTAVYNMVAFPFSRDHRLKVYFVQQVDLDTGLNTVSLTSLSGYAQSVAASIPSAQGQGLDCATPEVASRKNLVKCGWSGPLPHVVQLAEEKEDMTEMKDWVEVNVFPGTASNSATISVRGHNTRACRILFDKPVRHLSVEGGAFDPRFNATGEHGATEVRLWHRDWSQPWNVTVAWPEKADDEDDADGITGKAVCIWSDANAGAIPAFDEVQHYLPKWAVATKYSDGLVEASKGFRSTPGD